MSIEHKAVRVAWRFHFARRPVQRQITNAILAQATRRPGGMVFLGLAMRAITHLS